MRRRSAVRRWMLALPLIVYALPAQAADTCPSRPIRLVVGFGAGGATHIPGRPVPAVAWGPAGRPIIPARFIAAGPGRPLAQPVVVENKPAAGGIVATRD